MCEFRKKYAAAIRCSLVFILGFWATGGIAAELSLQDLKQIQKQLKTNEFLTVDFQQDVYKALRNRHKISSGMAYFRKPDSFRWILSKPKKSEWIFDGKVLLGIEGDATSAKKYGVGNAQAQELRRIVDMVMNLDVLLAQYELKKAEEMGGLVFIELLPKTEGEIRSAGLTIDRAKNFISGIKLNYSDDYYTTFSFTNPRVGVIEASMFAAPKGIKVRSEF